MSQAIVSVYESKINKRAQRATIAVAAAMYIDELLGADAFLAKLLVRIGVSEALIGVISSLFSFSFLLSLALIPLLQKKVSYKKVTLAVRMVGLTAYSLLFFLPFIPGLGSAMQVAAMVLVLLANIGYNLVASMGFRWTNEFVDPTKRASFAAVKESVSLVVGIIVTLVSGYVFDALSNAGKMDTAFLLFAILLLLVAIFSLICYLSIPDVDINAKDEAKRSFKELRKQTLGNKNFRKYLYLIILWEMSRYVTIGFLGTYKTVDLQFSLLMIQIFNTVACLLRLFVTPFFGRFSDKHTFVGGMELAFWFVLAGFVALIFTTPETRWLMLAFMILYQVGLAGIEQNLSNSCYSYVKQDYITEALILRGAIGGLCGFLASAVAGLCYDGLDVVRPLGMAPQRWLAVISCLLILVSIAYARHVVRKIPVKIQ